jgi:hypothetical protein
VKGALDRIAVPDAKAARDRAHDVVLAAFAERDRVPRPGRGPLVGVAVALAAAIGLAVASPPGMAVVDRVREIVGVERSVPALFSLPGGGKLLVTADDGVWVADANGKKRLLRGYGQASWSPFGRFLVATRENELAALEPDGDVHWTLARPGVHSPRWTGSPTETRIAYVDRTGIRVVAGDGTDDRLLAPGASGPVAWRPGPGQVLAYVSAREIRVEDVETRRVLWRVNGRVGSGRTILEWSSDGRRLLLLSRGSVRVFGSDGRLIARTDPSDGRAIDAAFQPGTHRVLVIRFRDGESTVSDLETGRPVFSGTGRFDDLTFSSNGRWLVLEWRVADQWVFLRTDRPRTIRAVSGIADQFGGGEAAIAGWCCAGLTG